MIVATDTYSSLTLLVSEIALRQQCSIKIYYYFQPKFCVELLKLCFRRLKATSTSHYSGQANKTGLKNCIKNGSDNLQAMGNCHECL